MPFTLFDVLLQETPPELLKSALRHAGNQLAIPGFRPGKIPPKELIRLAKANTKPANLIRQAVAAKISRDYFSDRYTDEKSADTVLSEIATEEFDLSDTYLVGYLAAYIACNKTTNFPYSTEEVVAYIKAQKKSVIDFDDEDSKDGTSQISPHEEDNEKEINVPNINSHENVSNHSERKFQKMRYLGYINIVTSQYYSQFFNFYPTAVFDDDNTIHFLNSYEIEDKFPSKGNINIYSSNRNTKLLQETFYDGEVCIIDISDDIIEQNYKNGSPQELNQTNFRMSVESLRLNDRIFTPNSLNLYQCFPCDNLKDILSVDTPYSIGEDDTILEGEMIVIQDSNYIAGPFKVMSSASTTGWYIHPQSKKANYIFKVHRDNVSRIDVYPVNDMRSFVQLDANPSELVDYISDKALVDELRSIINGGNIDALGSAFANASIDSELLNRRRERLRTLFEQKSAFDEDMLAINRNLSNWLIRAIETEDNAFDAFIDSLTQNATFMQRIASYRIISDAIDEKKRELDDTKALLIKHQTALSDAIQQTTKAVEDTRSVELTEEIQAKENDLAKIAERLKIATTVEELQFEEKHTRRNIDEKKQELESIKEQAGEFLEAFKTQVEEPMGAFSRYVIQEKIAGIITSTASGTTQTDSADTDDIWLKRLYSHKQLLTSSNAENLTINALCDRVRKFRPTYTKNEIINLFICITQGFLTVFSGAPGTGKTSICNIIAHALGIDGLKKQYSEDELCIWGDDPDLANRYVSIAVERGWTNKRDFIGYFNALTNSFDKTNPMVFHAVNMLNVESKNYCASDTMPYLILLDEANLSPMEYYWADFMKACDDDINSFTLTIGEKIYRLTPSLRFLATINNDHTTESLSPRLIDRSWVITLPEAESSSVVSFDEYESPISMETLINIFGNKQSNASIPQVAQEVLNEVYAFMKTELQNPVSPRVKLAINDYCIAGNARFDDPIASILAVDYAIAQRILPSIHGNGLDYGLKLEKLKQLMSTHNLAVSERLLDKILATGNRNMQYFDFFA